MKITFHISVKLSTGIQNPTYDLKCFVFNELEQNFEFAINLQEKKDPHFWPRVIKQLEFLINAKEFETYLQFGQVQNGIRFIFFIIEIFTRPEAAIEQRDNDSLSC